jgi:hypothetical protein
MASQRTRRRRCRYSLRRPRCRTARLWCAYLLDLSPFEVFPFGATSDPAGSQHMFEHLTARVAQLRADAPEPNPTNAELTGYLRTLAHCADVLAVGFREVMGAAWLRERGQVSPRVYVFQESAMTTELKHKTAAALDFLRRWSPDEVWVLYGDHP